MKHLMFIISSILASSNNENTASNAGKNDINPPNGKNEKQDPGNTNTAIHERYCCCDRYIHELMMWKPDTKGKQSPNGSDTDN